MRPLSAHILRLLAISFFICFAAIPSAYAAKAQGIDLISLKDANRIASDHLSREAKTISQWTNAVLSSPVIHYDLVGNPTAYVFSVLNNGADLGYITISSRNVLNPVLEFSTAPARHKASLSAIRSKVSEQGLVIDEQKPLYLGMLAYFYQIGNQEPVTLIEMGSQRIITLDRSSPPEIQPVTRDDSDSMNNSLDRSSKSLGTSLSSEFETQFKLLYGPDYSWYRGCGPTAVGNAMGYWADRGYPNLVYGGSGGDYSGTIDQLADLMGTSPEGWTWLPIDDDVREFAEIRGYSFQSDETEGPSYDTYVQEINNHLPVVVLVNGHQLYGNHFITGFGYEFDPGNSNYRYMIVHDTWESTPEDYWVQFGAGYDRIWFDTVEPPEIKVDTTPPNSAVSPLSPHQTFTSFNVSWSGTDEGWGIRWFDIQYRDGQNGQWTDWITKTTTSQAVFTGVKGHKYYFRSRAIDLDHNDEGYPVGDGDTYTYVANLVISGYVRSNRDLPVMNAEIETSPPNLGQTLSNYNGYYRIGIPVGGVYSITVKSADSFGLLPPMQGVEVNNDLDNINFNLTPAVDLVANGGFEAGGLDSWSVSGNLPPTITQVAHTGGYAVILGGNPPGNGGSSVLGQTITVLPDIEIATLSLVFKPETVALDGDQFMLLLMSGSETTTYSIPLTSSAWQHVWYDLSDFSGKQVEIRLEVKQGTAINPTTVIVDEVSVGQAAAGPSRLFLPVVIKK